ncbi:winged helix-turn-helix transcriptional regulator [Streptomyces malaysiensis subsp. malaysiensis]
MTDLDLDTFAADGTRICSIADALELIGDRWSLLVVREIGFEVHRFDQIRTRTGAPRQMLAARLRKLEEVGVVERRKYQDRPERYEYVLTEAGRALFPVLVDLRKWGSGLRRRARSAGRMVTWRVAARAAPRVVSRTPSADPSALVHTFRGGCADRLPDENFT